MKYVNKKLLIASTTAFMAWGLSLSPSQNNHPLALSFIAPAYAAQDFTLENIQVKFFTFDVTMKSVTVKGSNLSKEAFLELFKWDDWQKMRTKWQDFSALSVTIPEIKMSGSFTSQVKDQSVTFTIDLVAKNTEYQDINSGKIALMSVDNMTAIYTFSEKDDTRPTSVNFDLVAGKQSVTDIDIGANLEVFFTKADNADAPLKQLYKEAKIVDLMVKGTITSPKASEDQQAMLFDMAIASARYFDVKGRPFQSFAIASFLDPEFTKQLADDISSENGEKLARFFVNYYRDALSSVEASFEMLDAKANIKPKNPTDDFNNNIDLSFGKIVSTPGSLIFSDLKANIDSKEKFQFTMGEYSFNGFSFAPTVQALNELSKKEAIIPELKKPGAIGKIIPKLGKITLANLNFSKNTDGKLASVFSLNSFVINTEEQTYGIPSTAQITLSDYFVNKDILPEDTQETLEELGLDSIRMSSNIDYAWNKNTSDFVIKSLGGAVGQLGQVNATAMLKNIPEIVFTLDPKAQMALIAATITNVGLTVKDEGGVEKILKFMSISKEEAAQSIQLTAGLLGGGKEGIETISKAVQYFITKPTTLTINIKANDKNGLGAAAIAMSKDNPLMLLDQVTIEADNK